MLPTKFRSERCANDLNHRQLKIVYNRLLKDFLFFAKVDILKM